MSPDPFFPSLVFAPEGPVGAPRVFIGPQRYVQGPGVLDHLGKTVVFVHHGMDAATVAIAGQVTLDTLWHAVPAFPTVSEVWLRLLETYGL